MAISVQTSQIRSRLSRWIPLAAILALATALRFWALGQESLWFDEAFSVSVAEWDPRWIILKLTEIGLRSTDRNIFHLMLHYALLVSRSEVMIRAIPAVSGILSVLALYALSRRLFGTQVAVVSSFLLAISPMHVYYSREARAYALLTLFGLLAAYFMVRALDDNRATSWLGYVILAACGVYTHSFGVLVVVALDVYAAVYLIMRQPGWRPAAGWLAAQAALGLALLPFVRGFFSQSSAGWGAWIGDRYGVPTLRSLAGTMAMFSFNTAYDKEKVCYVAGLAVFATLCLAAVVGGVRRLRRSEWRQTRGLALALTLIYLIVPIAALFVASQITPLFLDRYLLPFVPPYLMLVSVGLLNLRRVEWQSFAVVAILIITIPALFSVYEPGQKEDWRGAAAYVQAGAQDNDLIVFYDAYTNIAFNFYYQGKGKQLQISRYAPDEEMNSHAADIASTRRVVWLILSHADERRLTALVDARPAAKRSGERRFVGIGVLSYQITPRS